MFMNTWEIDQAVDRHKAHPVLGPATRFLAALRDYADANSDGWHSWPAPSRAARRLQEFIQAPEGATVTGLKKALAPVRAFCTRKGIPVPELR